MDGLQWCKGEGHVRLIACGHDFGGKRVLRVNAGFQDLAAGTMSFSFAGLDEAADAAVDATCAKKKRRMREIQGFRVKIKNYENPCPQK